MPDALVATLNQVLDGEPCPHLLVHHGSAEPACPAGTNHNHGHVQVQLFQGLQGSGVRHQGHDAVHTLVHKMTRGIRDRFRADLADGRDAHEVAGIAGGLLHAEQRVGGPVLRQLAGQDAYGVRSPRHQAACRSVPPVPQFGNGRLNAFPGRLAHVGVVVDDAGYGLVRDAGTFRYIFKSRKAPLAAVGHEAIVREPAAHPRNVRDVRRIPRN
ncbi:hypothetical protein D9M72_449370 [compost metagenome]